MRLSSGLAGLAFYCGPVALVAAAVSARTSGVVASREVVEARMGPYVSIARQVARDEGVPADLVLAVACAESAGRPGVRSRAGAVGLMQVMPATAAELAVSDGGGTPDLTDPRTSLRLGARYLRRQRDAFAGHAAQDELALCAYNAGPGKVRGWLEAEPLDDGRASLGAWIRYGETRDYVRRVGEWRGRWAQVLAAR